MSIFPPLLDMVKSYLKGMLFKWRQLVRRKHLNKLIHSRVPPSGSAASTSTW